MKKFLLYSIFLFPFFCEGQTYQHMPDSSAIWKLDYMDPNVCPSQWPDWICYSLNSWIIKDTLIGSYTYHLTNDPNPCNCITAYREDTVTRKIYFPLYVSPGNFVDTLLFDFNLQVGDSITQNVGGIFQGQKFAIAQIDSVYNGSVYLRRWNLEGGVTEVVEGIGNLRSLFGEFGFFEGTWEVKCMLKDNQTFYPSISGGCSLVEVNEISKNDFQISSNPAHNILNVQCNLPNAELKIYDMTGREVAEEKIHSQLSTFNFQLKAGVYFVRVVTSGSAMAVQKLIVE